MATTTTVAPTATTTAAPTTEPATTIAPTTTTAAPSNATGVQFRLTVRCNASLTSIIAFLAAQLNVSTENISLKRLSACVDGSKEAILVITSSNATKTVEDAKAIPPQLLNGAGVLSLSAASDATGNSR